MEGRIKLRRLKRDILNDLEVGSVQIAKQKINRLPKNQNYLKSFLDSIKVERISGTGSREQSTSRFKNIKWGKSNKKSHKKKRSIKKNRRTYKKTRRIKKNKKTYKNKNRKK